MIPRLASIIEYIFKEENSEASEEAERLGLDDLRFGRYGKDGKVTHTSDNGKLVPVSPPTDFKVRAAHSSDDDIRGPGVPDLDDPYASDDEINAKLAKKSATRSNPEPEIRHTSAPRNYKTTSPSSVKTTGRGGIEYHGMIFKPSGPSTNPLLPGVEAISRGNNGLAIKFGKNSVDYRAVRQTLQGRDLLGHWDHLPLDDGSPGYIMKYVPYRPSYNKSDA